MSDEERARAELVEVCHRMYERGWVANHDGNVSVRVSPSRIVATPTSVSKGDMRPEHLIVVDLSGQQLEGTRKGFSELALHLRVYQSRSDVRAVVHAHPVTATAFAVTGLELDPTFMPEAVVSLGDRIPTAPFALPYGEEGASPLAGLVDEVDVMLLANHGVLSYGPDVFTAYFRLELVEHLARIQVVARQLGETRRISPDQVRYLMEKRRKAGLGPEARRSVDPHYTTPSSFSLPPGAAASAWTGGYAELPADLETSVSAGKRLPDLEPAPPPTVPSNDDLQALLEKEVRRVLGK